MITERQLQDECIAAIAVHDDCPRQLAACGYAVTELADDHRLAVEIAVHRGLVYLGQNRTPQHSQPHRARFLKTVARGIEEDSRKETADGQPLCGFGFIIGAFLSWLIGQALSWIWNAFAHRSEVVRLCGSVAGVA